MDKLKLAHDYAMQHLKNSGGKITMHSLCSFAWQYADAMQVEADKLINKERPGVLCEVDWSQAPSDAIGWMIFDGASTWLGESGFLIEEAPSFGFTGSHIMERPQ